MVSVGANHTPFAQPPEPGEVHTLNALTELLRLLKVWAGNPSYDTIAKRVNALWASRGLIGWATYKNTVAACFTAGRSNPNDDLLLAIVTVLGPDNAYVDRWRQALRIVRGEAEAATFVQAEAVLPADIPEFTGRANELRLLTAPSSGMAVWVIEGMAGIGKTQLTVHAGYQFLRQRADHVLFVDLRGFHTDTRQPPADPAAVLDSFLRLLGVRGRDIPHNLTGRTSLYRERLRQRRVLVVLDNAASAAQVTPLLADTAIGLTLITSRRRLDAVPGARRLPLWVLGPADSARLLRKVVGARRFDADAETAAEITAALGHHPLALCLSASRIASRPGWTLHDHLQRLTGGLADGRLEEVMEMSLALSYEELNADCQHLLRMIALHPGNTVTVSAAAALAGGDASQSARDLDHLTDAHLLARTAPEQYRLHDLVRAYAVSRAMDEDSPTDQQAARGRLFTHLLHAAAVAMDRYAPHERDLRPPVPTSETPGPDLPTSTAAKEWLNTTRTTLTAVGISAADRQWPGADVGALALVLHRYLHTAGYYRDAEALLTRALRSSKLPHSATALTNLGLVHLRLGAPRRARKMFRRAVARAEAHGDATASCRALTNLGVVSWQLGWPSEAVTQFGRALDVADAINDRVGMGRALNGLGAVYGERGIYRHAAACFNQALAIAIEIGDTVLACRAIGNLGVVVQRRGDYHLARRCHRDALRLAREVGDRATEATTLANLTTIYHRIHQPRQAMRIGHDALCVATELGDPAAAAAVLTALAPVQQRLGRARDALRNAVDAVQLAVDAGDRAIEANARATLALVHHLQRLYWDAASLFRSTCVMARALDDLPLLTEVHNGLGGATLALGMAVRAAEHHDTALRISERIGNRYEQARAHRGLALALVAAGQRARAATHEQQATNLAASLRIRATTLNM